MKRRLASLVSLRDAALMSAMQYALIGEDAIQPHPLDTACC